MTVMEQILPQFIITICEFLATPIIKNSFCSIEVWTIVHFFCGALLLFLLRKEKHKYWLLFFFLVLFEMFELTISYLAPIILKETAIDLFTDLWVGLLGAITFDLIFGMLGGYLVGLIVKLKK